MTDDEKLDLLSEYFGIEPMYWDVRGERHVADLEHRKQILAAMGVDVATSDGLDLALRDVAWRRHARLVQPVYVLHETELPLRIPLAVPRGAEGTQFHWRFVEEGGSATEGEFVPWNLQRIDEREAGGEWFTSFTLELPLFPPLGYHQLTVGYSSSERRDSTVCRIIIAPPRCFMLPELDAAQRIWGISIQLYSLRSSRNWGIGDLRDLEAAAPWLSERGVNVVGLNPLHALFANNPGHSSPYSPNSRLALNLSLIDVEAIHDYAECGEAQELVRSETFQQGLSELREAAEVDHRSVNERKRMVLEKVYRHFCAQHLAGHSSRADEFKAFIEHRGEPLHAFALYEAIQEILSREDPLVWGWPAWPDDLREYGSTAVGAFAEEHGERVTFYKYVQWQAELQLRALRETCTQVGQSVGLYLDIALGVNGGGAEAWRNRGVFAFRASMGAPPDDLGPAGQNWGLPPMVPERLRDAGYEPFIHMLQYNMQFAGAIRLDHIMSLMRLFWIPEAAPTAQGVYVRYPFADLLKIVALESQRNRCIVIGEDLGTVPDEVREGMYQNGILSYKVLFFMRGPAGFHAPERYPAEALVVTSTHDLPTLRGYWERRDIQLRKELKLVDDTVADRLYNDRNDDVRDLLASLRGEGAISESLLQNSGAMSSELSRAIHAYLARTPCKIQIVQLEDILDLSDQANLPGTTVEHPNWGRKVSLSLDELKEDPFFHDLCSDINAGRNGGPMK